MEPSMTAVANRIVDKLWNTCHELRNDWPARY